MTVKLNYKDFEYDCQRIIWDRDTIFLNSDDYWMKIVASLAQKIAELLSDNWTKFNQIRTEVIKTFLINPESGDVDNISPLFIIPTSSFHFLILNTLKITLSDKTVAEINTFLNDLISKELKEYESYLSTAILLDKFTMFHQFSSVEQLVLTNDGEASDKIFASKLPLNLNIKTLSQVNKENLSNLLKPGALFITGNSYLGNYYKNIGFDNVLFVEDFNLIKTHSLQVESLVTINIDGASKGNPGRASIGAVFKDKSGNVLSELSESIGVQTNNYAEYTALIRALEVSIEKGYKNLNILSDSELVVKQVNKLYKVKDENIKSLYEKVGLLIPRFKSFKLSHILREKNSIADGLANKALNS